MGHDRLASKSAFASVRSDVRFAGVFDKIVDFFTGKLNDKVEAAPVEEVSSEEQKKAEAKFEAEIRDIVDKSLSSLVEMNFSPDKIRALKGGGAVSKEFSDAVRKSGLNVINYTFEFYRYMLGHALQPTPNHFGISKEQASFQESLVKKKLGMNEPAELDPGHMKRQREKATPSRLRSYSDLGLRRIASRVAADEDELFGLDEEEFQGSEEEPQDSEEELDFEGEDEGEESGGAVEIDFTDGPTEYSCRIELSMTATFEGLVSREVLTSKVQSELKASIEAGMKAVSNDLSLQSTEVKVLPIVMDCSVVDESDGGMDEFGMGSQSDPDEQDDDEDDEPSDEENAEEEFEEEPEEEDFDLEDEQD